MRGKKYFAAAAIFATVLLWVALALLGGPLNRLDHAAIDALAAKRAAFPLLTHAGVWISFAGSAPATIGLAVICAGFLLLRRSLSKAASLLLIVLSGRLMVEMLKLSIGRPRPDLDLHAVAIHSLSFPSGHAANSMITFVAIALFSAPERHRKAALGLAIAASLVVGATRPLLGVHWPSDVIAGWLFGLLWVVGGWQIAGRFHEARSA
jgi:undecaprenyl-diphosphatase